MAADKNSSDNAKLSWAIDQRCMNCGAARAVAPELIIERGGKSVFSRQPATDEETEMAWLAAELCPTRSVSPTPLARAPEGLYPHLLTDDIYLCGHNARSSYGAHSYLVKRDSGNVLVDSPAFNKKLVPQIEVVGGIKLIVLSHADDVADADKWASQFGAEVLIHRADRHAAPYATMLVDGHKPQDVHLVEPGVEVLPVPGHTEGSVALLIDETYLFTGDSLIWSREKGTLVAVSDYCMHSWSEQGRSLRALSDRKFEQVFPGHGSWSPRLSSTSMRQHLRALVESM